MDLLEKRKVILLLILNKILENSNKPIINNITDFVIERAATSYIKT